MVGLADEPEDAINTKVKTPGHDPAYKALKTRSMLNQDLKDKITARLLPDIRMPGQYVGGELNSRARTIARSAARSAWPSPTPTRSA